MQRSFFSKSLITIQLFLIITIPGCKKKEQTGPATHASPVTHLINKLVELHPDNPTVKVRADSALLRWNNKKLDSSPILISAFLTPDKAYIGLGIYDEDRDIAGIVIREQQILADGRKIIKEEDYPLFVHRIISDFAGLYGVPVEIRTSNQKKDVQLWDTYIKADYEQNAREYVLSDRFKKRYHTDPCSAEDFIHSYKVWKHLLPALWISEPQPDELEVTIWVYDKAGNKSEPIKIERNY